MAEAHKIDGTYDNLAFLQQWMGTSFCLQAPSGHVFINTPKGIVRGDVGDWIVEGRSGEYHPCKPDFFATTQAATHNNECDCMGHELVEEGGRQMSELKPNAEYRIVCARHGIDPMHRLHAYPKKTLAKAKEALVESEIHTTRVSQGLANSYYGLESPWRIELRQVGDWVAHENRG